MKRNVMVSLLFTAVILLSFTACSEEPAVIEEKTESAYTLEQYVVFERARSFWVCGKNTTIGVSVSEFPPIFPELFSNLPFDAEDDEQKAINKMICAQTADLYYEAFFTALPDRYHPDSESKVMHFSMFGGKPGNMEVWGVTFGMTRAEAEVAMRKTLDIEWAFPDESVLPVFRDWTLYMDPLTEAEKQYADITADSNVEMLSYCMYDTYLDLLMVDGRVCGMTINASEYLAFL